MSFGLGRQCHKFEVVHHSDKLLACAFFVGFPARLPVCGVQSCRVHVMGTLPVYSVFVWAMTLLGKSI